MKGGETTTILEIDGEDHQEVSENIIFLQLQLFL